MPETSTLTNAIDDAAKDIKFPSAPETETQEQPKANEEPKHAESDEKDDTEAQKAKEAELTIQGRNLLAALNDPEKAPIVIKFLAEQAGYTKVETKKEAAEVKDEVLESLKEHLGSEFDFLAEKLAPAINKIVDASWKKNTADIREALETQQQEKTQNVAQTTIDNIAKEFFDAKELPKEVSNEMSRLMEKYNPSSGDSVEDYITDMFGMAANKLGITKTGKVNKGNLERNRSDAASRLSTSAGATPSGEVVVPKKMSLDESIRDAIEKVKKKE